MIEHIAIWTKDLEQQKDFFLTYFNCTANNKYENKNKGFSSYFISFSCGARIELMHHVKENFQRQKEGLGLQHIALAVGSEQDVIAITKQIEADGFTVRSMPRHTGDGYFESVIEDAEGNIIELTTDLKPTIAVAEEYDLEDILYLQKCCYLSEAAIYNDYTIAPLRQTLDDTKADFTKQTILKLTIHKSIVGSVRGYTHEGTCYVGKLIVDRKYQNKGYGSLLLHAIEKTFAGVNRFELFTGSRSEKNLHIYKKHGYCIFKESDEQVGMVFLEKVMNEG